MSLYELGQGSLSSAGPAAIGVIEVKRFNYLTLHISTLTSETIGATISVDNGTTYSTTLLAMALISTPLTQTVVALANATYVIKLPPCTHIKFTKSSTADTALINFALRQT